MRGWICLSSPPTGLDAYSQERARTTTMCQALAPTRAQLADSTDLRQPTSIRLPPGETVRCKRSKVVPEYQPDVHRLRLSTSAQARLTLSGRAFLRKP